MAAPGAHGLRTTGAVVAVLVALLTGACDDGPGPTPASPTATAGPVRSGPRPVEIEVTDVASLPLGPPARVVNLVRGVLHWRGRDLRTDLPPGAGLELLGVVDGRMVGSTGYRSAGQAPGDRFWTIDASGHARQVGGVYQSYDYTPLLVTQTGHLWVHYEDRTTPRTIWELDAVTGRRLAAWPHNRVPRGLAPADQALADAWVARRLTVPDTAATSPDETYVVDAPSVRVRDGVFASDVVVRRGSADGEVVAHFTFPDVSTVRFEDEQHVLVQTSDRIGRHGAIVRCSVADGSCERTTGVGGPVSLGVVRPRFRPGTP